jgi:hypothetical protein
VAAVGAQGHRSLFTLKNYQSTNFCKTDHYQFSF